MFILPQDYWEVRVTEKKGRGIFAKKDIPTNTVIGDYIGQVIEDKDYIEGENGLYGMTYNEKVLIIGDPKEIGVHIINHCCTANCEVIPYDKNILFFTLRHIFAGEELSINYFLGPPDNECNPCHHACFCDSVLCRGSWHVSQKAIDKWDAFLEEYGNDKSEESTLKPGDYLLPMKEYPKTIPDYQIFDPFANTDVDPLIVEGNVIPSQEEIRAQIKKTGRGIYYKDIDLLVYGFVNGLLISKK